VARQAGVTFLEAFLGSFVTLLAGSALVDVNVEGDILPDARLLAQMVVSAFIAGAIALIGWAQLALREAG
jgi:hypothetical protein